MMHGQKNIKFNSHCLPHTSNVKIPEFCPHNLFLSVTWFLQ